MLKTSLVAAAAVFALAGAASAQTLQPTDFVHRHMDAAAKGDVDAIVADYADDAVTITANGVTVGKAAIRASFARMFPAGGRATAGPMAGMKVDKVWQEGNVGLVSWEAGPVKGGTTVIAFVEDPDGYKIELIERHSTRDASRP